MIRGNGELIPKGKKWQCAVCELIFKSKRNLLCNLKNHGGERPYRGWLCSSAFTAKSGLARHARSHRAKAFECNVCDATFMCKRPLVCHLMTHAGNKPWRCSVCDATFPWKDHLIVHLRKHTGEHELYNR